MKVSLMIALIAHLTGLWYILPNATKSHFESSIHLTPAIPTTATVAPPVESPEPTPLSTEPGASIYAIDATTGQVLYAQNATAPRPIASITKLMTVMVALESHKPDDTVTVGQLPAYEAGAELMGLTPGQQFQVSDLLKATLIASDNDAADALALATSDSLPRFYDAMNAKAQTWGLTSSHFASANGLIDASNTVSAADVARIAALDLTSPALTAIMETPSAVITDATGKTYNLTTTNDLLATGQFYGIKTGYTLAAGECFVGLTKINGHQVITVVLGTSDRFGQTQTLVNWIGQNWSWQ